MAERRIAVGRITKTHGVNGEVTIAVDSDDPERFRPPARFHTDDARYPLLVLREARPGPRGLIASFAGVTSMERAQQLTGIDLLIDADDRRALTDDEYWPDELVGLEVRIGSEVIGRVSEVVLGPQDRLVVETDDGEHTEGPFVSELVPEVDPAAGWLRIDPPEGLFNRG